MAIAHHRTHRSMSNGLALLLVALSVICGLVSFVLCLAAEGSRTEAAWYIMSKEGEGSSTNQCIYDASGRRPLAYAAGAFLSLVVAMFAEHAYLLVVVTSPRPPASLPQTPQPPIPPLSALLSFLPQTPQLLLPPAQALISSIRAHTRQARYLFLTTWIVFAVAEALLLIGMGVESSHICQWSKPRSSCHVIRPGLFAAAGVFGLLAVLIGIALYLTASRTQKLHQQVESMRPPLPSAPLL